MQKTKIEWARSPDGSQGYTWNPVVGCSGKNCAVVKECYARRTAKRFKQRCQKCYDFTPHLHRERLEQPMKLKIKKPVGIFVCSMSDLFDDKLLFNEKGMVLDAISWLSLVHRIYILTKQPQNFEVWRDHVDLSRCWVGVTVNRKQDLWRIDELRKIPAQIHFISFEPLMEDLGEINLEGIQWIILGAQTKPEKQPSEYWINKIIHNASRLNIPIFLKNNLKPTRSITGEVIEYNFNAWQEFPKVS